MATCISYHTEAAKQAKAFLPDSEADGVLEWVDRADRSNRTWARNVLTVLAALIVPLLAALKSGVITP